MQAAAGCLALDQSLLDQLLWKYSSAEEGQVATINAGSFVFDCLVAGRFCGLLSGNWSERVGSLWSSY